ncbi:Paneth cell-specific alpha-defensin 16 precursor [Equus caballus]|uniref:Paneth cell-specific alpha-defensin 16 n=1 Tax=Equus caballus TaxID=9796 RepID=C8BNG9_HORSE|nr:Paneth cell-specific alpha-defensin 16 precursor [Equus caballus]ACV49742.1 Paneth cell-specific alpha-defensin 16 [Equus caballus]
MRTLALLAALLVFALQAQTEPLGDTDDQLPAQDQPGSEVQQMTISFEGGDRSAREASGHQSIHFCICRYGRCHSHERSSGSCPQISSRHKRCCLR